MSRPCPRPVSHPGAYNFGPNSRPDLRERCRICAGQQPIFDHVLLGARPKTGARAVNWDALAFTPTRRRRCSHDILTIQSNLWRRPDDTVRATRPTGSIRTPVTISSTSRRTITRMLAIYDAGGKHDKIDLSGFTASQFVDLHPGSFSSIGGGMPTPATANAELAKMTAFQRRGLGTLRRGLAPAHGVSLYENDNAGSIATDLALYGETPVARHRDDRISRTSRSPIARSSRMRPAARRATAVGQRRGQRPQRRRRRRRAQGLRRQRHADRRCRQRHCSSSRRTDRPTRSRLPDGSTTRST